MASVVSDIDPVDVPSDVITMLLGSMSIQDRSNCALVCSDWAKAAAAATTRSIVRHGMRDLTQLQRWLEKHGVQVEKLQLHTCRWAELAGLPCAQLQDLLLHGLCYDPLRLDSRVWSDIAAATKLTSVSLDGVRAICRQADVVSALTALPDLQHLVLEDVEFELSDSRLLQQLTKLTRLGLGWVAAEALQHLSLQTKLQHLSICPPRAWAAANYPQLQELQALTILSFQVPQEVRHNDIFLLDLVVPRFPACVSRLTALQQLELVAAQGTQLDALTALTTLTKLGVTQLTPSATPLQLPAIQCLELQGPTYQFVGPIMHASYLASCTQLRRLSLQSFCFTGPGSLVVSSTLQELKLQECRPLKFGHAMHCVIELDPVNWELVYPGPGRLPHLTSLVLLQCAHYQQADFERLAACCSNLQSLQLGFGFGGHNGDLLGVSALAPLPHLTKLHLSRATDKQCSSWARLTGLRVLHVEHPRVSLSGLRHLARLEQLTALGFGGEFEECKVGRMVQQQLSDKVTVPPCRHALVNKAPAGSPPDVSARLLRACNLMPAGGGQQ